MQLLEITAFLISMYIVLILPSSVFIHYILYVFFVFISKRLLQVTPDLQEVQYNMEKDINYKTVSSTKYQYICYTYMVYGVGKLYFDTQTKKSLYTLPCLF